MTTKPRIDSPARMIRPSRAALAHFGPAGAAVLALFAAATCGGREQTYDGKADVDIACRARPIECEGLVGAPCAVEDDCDDGVCCLSEDCGRGMCTYLCGTNADCPPGLLCEGGFCFWQCSVDTDCAPGQQCEHDDTVCQY